MKRRKINLWCVLLGHKWWRWGSKIAYSEKAGTYRRILVARCRRCDAAAIEKRWAFTKNAGALRWIKGGEAKLR